MTAKEYLLKFRRNEAHIGQLKMQIDTLKTDYKYLSGIQYGDKVQTSPRDVLGDQVAAALDQLQELIERLADEIVEMQEERARIIKQIQAMEKAEHCQLLFRRYVEGLALIDIAKDDDIDNPFRGYEYGTIRNMHGAALKAFAEQFLDAQELAGAPETSQGYSA